MVVLDHDVDGPVLDLRDTPGPADVAREPSERGTPSSWDARPTGALGQTSLGGLVDGGDGAHLRVERGSGSTSQRAGSMAYPTGGSAGGGPRRIVFEDDASL